MTMSLEVFEKLEAKVQQAIDTITLLQMEIEELKEKNNSLSQEVQNAQHQREELERENNHLKEQQNGWQDRLQALLGRMEEV
ncbi:septal ring assembly protein ZapB [Escherichia coli]|nr:septal ring assembly protein ZapB [Escherichia coli]